MNAPTTLPPDGAARPAPADPLVEHGYYQWVPLAPGEEVPPEDEEDDPPLLFKGGDRGVVADAAASDRGQHHPLAPSSQEEGEDDIHRSPSGQPVALTPGRMADFLESLQTLGNVAVACPRAGVARPTAYRARRRVPGFARAWDAALVAARAVAESELAERAINGVEEAVYYHGEEVARRRRYDSRLLLAHLARLDKAAERLDVAATLPHLDDQIDALRAGAAPDAAMPGQLEPDALRAAQEQRAMVADPRGEMAAAEQAAEIARWRAKFAGDENSHQDSVTPVTPCPDCGGLCLDALEDDALELTGEDCQWLGNRLDRMDAARPADAEDPLDLADNDYQRAADIEMHQLAAFEAGDPEWWASLPETPGAAADDGGNAGAGESAAAE